jgi:hypothetical protein
LIGFQKGLFISFSCLFDGDESHTGENFNKGVFIVAVVSKFDDQSVDSSFDICRGANGFCVCVGKEIFRL